MDGKSEDWAGSLKVALLVKGDAGLSVDLDQARILAVDDAARSLILELPPPQVLWARLDHEKTKVYSVDRYGLWRLRPKATEQVDLLNDVLARAQESVNRAAAGHLEEARRHAAEVIAQACRKAGWTVQFRWIGDEAPGPGR